MTDPVLAAQYVRMSTERQDFSVELQSAVNEAYAKAKGYELVRTYADEGISGLRIENRPGLRSLIADVVAGEAPFSVVLVYDISRWGRFQNPDQAAHYEFLCAEAGVSVEYTTEPFANDGSMASGLLKSIKRLMAAEYSRELSAKLKRAARGLWELGYWTGGQPGYALRREVVTRTGVPVKVLERGEVNAYPRCRTRVVWGPPDEIATVRLIYRLYLRRGMSYQAVAAALDRQGVRSEDGKPWRWNMVRQILTNEKYAGIMVHGRVVRDLRKQRRAPRSEWRPMPGIIPPIVSPRTFKAAQQERVRRRRCPSTEELVDRLRDLLAEYGHLSVGLVEAHSGHGADFYRRRFGDLLTLFRQLGYEPTPAQLRQQWVSRCRTNKDESDPFRVPDDALLAKVRAVLATHGRLSQPLLMSAKGMPSPHTLRRRFGSLEVLYRAVGYEPTSVQRKMMLSVRNGPGAVAG